MGKGTPDNSRYLHIYTRSLKQKEKFERIAEEAGYPASPFYLSILEDWQAGHEGLEPPKQSEDQALKEQNTKLIMDLKNASLLIEKYESEIRIHRGEDFLKDDFRGKRSLDPDLLDILRRGQYSDTRILELLHIDLKDHIAVKGVVAQLEHLQYIGLIRKEQRGWLWIG